MPLKVFVPARTGTDSTSDTPGPASKGDLCDRIVRMTTAYPQPLPAPAGDAISAATLAELERIIETRHFRPSRNCTNLLRYIVEQTLCGNASALKERTLGVDVFGRETGYNTSEDPVVRTTAGEIRKRLAQYYQEPGCTATVRIELHTGSYVPEFHLLSPTPEPVHAETVTVPLALRRPSMPARIVVTIAATVLAATGYFMWPAPPLNAFWSPLLKSGDTVTLCVAGRPRTANPVGTTPETTPGPTLLDVQQADRIAFSGAQTLARLAGVMQAGGRKFKIVRQDAATLDNLRDGPVVVIGGFSNPWSKLLGQELRFTLDHRKSDGVPVIRDRQRPDDDRWSFDIHKPARESATDYAIISRFLEPKTGKILVIVAAIGRWGEQAAGEFLSDPANFAPVAHNAPRNWASQNIQAVIATDIINEHSGQPRLVGVNFWK